LKLCVDEDLASKELMARLEKAGHQVSALEPGASDGALWAQAQRQQEVVVTRNAVDFARLAEGTPEHHGLLLVYAENDRTRDMRIADIADAIGKVETTYPSGIAGQVFALNPFR
jgi:predicted nuclease of predicted toxin-antitoxin system